MEREADLEPRGDVVSPRKIATKTWEHAHSVPEGTVADFSFHDLASKKAPPGEALTMELVDQYLTDGFRTIGDPIKVSRDCLTNDFIGSFKPNWPTPGVDAPLNAQRAICTPKSRTTAQLCARLQAPKGSVCA